MLFGSRPDGKDAKTTPNAECGVWRPQDTGYGVECCLPESHVTWNWILHTRRRRVKKPRYWIREAVKKWHGRTHSPVMRSTAYIHSSQCFFNISFVSCKNTLVLVQVPRASLPSAALCFSCSLARINTADSGTRALTQAENIEMPLAVQNRVRHVFPDSGTKRKLMHAASR